MYEALIFWTLFLCVLWALVGPLVSPWIERRLELFLLGMAALAATIGGAWSEATVVEAFLRPMKVCGAILAGSLVFSFSHDNLRRAVARAADRLGLGLSLALAVGATALSAAVLTMPVAVLALVELLRALRLEAGCRARAAVLGCLAIGLGGGLTAVGGPVAAVALGRLAEAPYPVGKDYLLHLLGPWILPAIASLAALAALLCARRDPAAESPEEDPLSLWSILVLTGKLYVMVFALVLLGAGLVPLIDHFLLGAPVWALYWINLVSGVVDGPTLVSVELSPRMSQDQIRHLLLGVLISDGALIVGNAPNLVAAHKLKIPSRVWAREGVPVVLALMLFYFVSLRVWTG